MLNNIENKNVCLEKNNDNIPKLENHDDCPMYRQKYGKIVNGDSKRVKSHLSFRIKLKRRDNCSSCFMNRFNDKPITLNKIWEKILNEPIKKHNPIHDMD
jgi:hypothetical protein